MQLCICEEGKDVFKKDSGSRKIGKLSKRFVQSHLKAGEFGGAGGSGGGDSVRGGGIGDISRDVEGQFGHCGEEKEKLEGEGSVR